MPFDSGEDRIILKKNFAPDLFTTPDNDDILIKSFHSSIFGAYLGFGLGLFDSLRTLTHFTPSAVGLKVVGLAAPLATIGATYPAVTGIVANIRKKDDPINHAIGGFVAGSIWTVRSKNPFSGWIAGFGFAGFCFLNKLCHQKGVKLYPDKIFNKPSTTLDFNHYNRSFLATKDPILGKDD